jgi:cell fate (sporulation/competence/biofilm development) regulator YlbF (YheA/YmcA/DUF963 family)
VNPYDAAHILAKTLRESQEFKEYGDAQELLAKDGPAREMLLDFRKEQFSLQKQQLAGLEVAPEQLDKLDRLFEVLNMNLTLKRYLDAEFRFSRLMGDVQKIVNEAAGGVLDTGLMQQLGETLGTGFDEDEED